MYKVFFNSRKIEIISTPKNNGLDKGDIIIKDSKNTNYADILDFFEKSVWCNSCYLVGNTEHIFDKIANEFKIIEAGGGLVYNSENKFLGIYRHDKWDLPKGKKEPDENIETTAVREVEEECGLENVKIESFLCHTYHTYSLKNKSVLKKTYWYKMKYSGNAILNPQTEESITDAKWFNKSEVSEIITNTYPSIMEVLKCDKLV